MLVSVVVACNRTWRSASVMLKRMINTTRNESRRIIERQLCYYLAAESTSNHDDLSPNRASTLPISNRRPQISCCFLQWKEIARDSCSIRLDREWLDGFEVPEVFVLTLTDLCDIGLIWKRFHKHDASRFRSNQAAQSKSPASFMSHLCEVCQIRCVPCGPPTLLQRACIYCDEKMSIFQDV